MKIGIIGSGFESFPLMQILNQYDHEYHLFCDWETWPWGEKSAELMLSRAQKALKYFAGKVDAVIVPPTLEVEFQAAHERGKGPVILPLFQTYVLEHALNHSLVGKIGLLTEEATNAWAEELLRQIAKQYKLTDRQKKIGSKFQQPFAMRKKNVRMRNYFLTTFGKRDWIVRNVLKHDLRYFQDAKVDTLIPLSRWFFFYQRLISQRTNRKKIRFHGHKSLQKSFETLVQTHNLIPSPAYAITLHVTDTEAVLTGKKKWKQVLEKGGDAEIAIKYIKSL